MIRRKFELAIDNIDVVVTASIGDDKTPKIIKVELERQGLQPLNILPYLHPVDVELLQNQVELDLIS